MKTADTMNRLSYKTITRETKEGSIQTFIVSGESGITFHVEPSRSLDISSLRFNGISISYQAPIGVLHPRAFHNSLEGFSKTMFYGMLTTCGFENTGPSCTDPKGTIYSLHGSINNEEAENIAVSIEGSVIRITGTVCSTINKMHDFILKREITFEDHENRLTVSDEILNTSDKDQICLMYHYNFGPPFLSDTCILDIPYTTATPKNAIAQVELTNILKVHAPDQNQEPHVFYMTFSGETGRASIRNPEMGLEATLEFDRTTLPKMDLWKNLQPNKYVLALEPCNAFPYGRLEQNQRGEAQFLEKGEKKKYTTRLTIQRNN